MSKTNICILLEYLTCFKNKFCIKNSKCLNDTRTTLLETFKRNVTFFHFFSYCLYALIFIKLMTLHKTANFSQLSKPLSQFRSTNTKKVILDFFKISQHWFYFAEDFLQLHFNASRIQKTNPYITLRKIRIPLVASFSLNVKHLQSV